MSHHLCFFLLHEINLGDFSIHKNDPGFTSNVHTSSRNSLYTVHCYVPLVLPEKLVLESGFPCCVRPKDVHIKVSCTAPYLEISWFSYLCCNKEYNKTTPKQSYFTLRIVEGKTFPTEVMLPFIPQYKTTYNGKETLKVQPQRENPTGFC